MSSPETKKSAAAREKEPEEKLTPEIIRKREIEPHMGGIVGPGPDGNVQDSHLPPPRR